MCIIYIYIKGMCISSVCMQRMNVYTNNTCRDRCTGMGEMISKAVAATAAESDDGDNKLVFVCPAKYS